MKHVVVKAGHLLDVKTGKTLNNQAIVIEGDKIVSLGASDESKIPPDATTIDLPNATILPGLIDAHTHITFNVNDVGYEGLGISVPREALIGAKNARITLEAGFTTVRNVGARGLKIIIEDLMLEVMYQIPSDDDIEECVITKDVVKHHTNPITILRKAG